MQNHYDCTALYHFPSLSDKEFSLQLNCKVTFSFGHNVFIVILKINLVAVTLCSYINFCQLLPKKTATVFTDKSF